LTVLQEGWLKLGDFIVAFCFFQPEVEVSTIKRLFELALFSQAGICFFQPGIFL
jgi:hypothetical protein